MPLPTLGPTISSTGITAPTYAAILQSLQESFLGIYGADAYIAPDSQDGQLLAIVATAIDDSNQAAITLFNAFSPTYGQGTQLSSLVKINGLTRNISSFSSVDVTIGGVFGTIIENGIVKDANGNKWNLPAEVTIPISGSIIVSATAQNPGNIPAAIHSVTIINTPTFGWQTVTNETAAVPGAPIETDAALRVRQAQSTSLPSLSVMGGLIGALESLTGVTKVTAYENDTNAPDANGLPEHSISLVVYGGDVTEIATIIANKKTPGTDTYGSTTENVTDPDTGIVLAIHFYRPTLVVMHLVVNIKGLTGYTLTIGTSIKAALAAFLNAQPIGGDIYNSRLVGTADDTGFGNTYNVQSVYQARADMITTGGPYTAGATVINVTGATAFIPNLSRISIPLDNGTQLRAVVSNVAGTAVTFAPAIPSSRSVANGTIIYVEEDLAIAFNELSSSDVADITLTVT